MHAVFSCFRLPAIPWTHGRNKCFVFAFYVASGRLCHVSKPRELSIWWKLHFNYTINLRSGPIVPSLLCRFALPVGKVYQWNKNRSWLQVTTRYFKRDIYILYMWNLTLATKISWKILHFVFFCEVNLTLFGDHIWRLKKIVSVPSWRQPKKVTVFTCV